MTTDIKTDEQKACDGLNQNQKQSPDLSPPPGEHQTQARLQAVFDGIPEPLILVDHTLTIEMLNQKAAQYFETNQADAIGKTCYQICMSRKKPCRECKIQQLINKAEQVSFERNGLKNPDHIEKVYIYPLLQLGEKPGTAIVRISDITEEKKVEQELIRADKMIALGILVSGVAHEINNPNNFILLNSMLLKEAWTSIIPILDSYYNDNGEFMVGGLTYTEMREEAPKLFAGLEEGAKRIKNIVADLKDYARHEDTVDYLQEIDVNKALKSAIRLLNNMIRNATKDFTVEYGANLPAIKGNFQKLEQVIINLIQNACQAVKDNTDAISINTAYDVTDGNVVISVKDTGTGIPADTIERIMDPFFTTKRNTGGTGLGLFVSSQIIKDHGGRLAVESDYGNGSTFKIILPAVGRTRPINILVADDDAYLRTLILKKLKGRGPYAITEAENGMEACIKIGEIRPDLLILDIEMPDMDGLEICRFLKKDPVLSNIKVIVITGYAQSSKIEEIKNLGFEKIIEKPFSINTFIEHVQSSIAE